MQSKKVLFISIAVILILLAAIIIYQNIGKNNGDTQNDTITEENTADSLETDETIIEETATEETIDTIDTLAKFNVETTEITGETKTAINKVVKQYYADNGAENADILLEEVTKESDETTDLDQKKREIIETYKNLKTYIKPGLEENSYVVFTTYNIKFKNIETLAPGMSVLYVKKDDSGSFKISNNLKDATLNEYISQLSEEEDIKAVIEKINTKLDAAIKKDESLKTFIDYIS